MEVSREAPPGDPPPAPAPHEPDLGPSRRAMGRHSLPDQKIFWKTLVLFLVKWTIFVSFPVLGAWGAWRLVQSPEDPVPGAVVVRPSPLASPSAAPTPSPSPEPASSPAPPAPAPAPTINRPTIRLQVLNGSPTTGLALRAADTLREAGYRVVAVHPAARGYELTTVFFQPGQEEVALDVATLLGTTNAQPAPPTVDAAIPVTVVVGADFTL